MKTSRLQIGCLLASITIFAHAEPDLQLIQCSGIIQKLAQPHLVYSCDGDLLLSTGRISSEGDITISASKSLTLQNVLVEGSNITLNSDVIILGSDARFSVQQTLFVTSYSPNTAPVFNFAQSNTPATQSNSLTSLLLYQTEAGYSITNPSASVGAAAVVVLEPDSVSITPKEQEGGGSTSAAFILILTAGILLLKSGRAA